MSYTITQQATTPNAAYTRLLYTVSGSTNTARPQFQYVMDVYESGSSSIIKRTFSGINPAGVSVFDPSRIIQGQLEEDNSWKISSVTPFNSSSKVFTLEFGETFAASISSSAVIVEGIATTNTEVFRGVVEPNAGYYNWDSASYAVLSNMPATMSMQTNDFGTLSVYNNDVSYVSQSFYSASVGYVKVEEKNYSITDNFSSVPISGSTPYWNYVDVSVSSSLGLENYRYEASDETHREKTRFAFINKLGAWDYYNNYNPVRQAINVLREQYTAPRVDYSSLTSTYDISRRGVNDYHNSTDDVFTVDTDLLDKTNANWLEELIESPSVYIQRNGEFIPIVITDRSYKSNTNQARQKEFQYTINFKPANQPYGKWEPEYVTCPKEPISFGPLLLSTTSTPGYLGVSSGSILASTSITNGSGIIERGFLYSSQSATPTIGDANTTKVAVGSGIGDYQNVETFPFTPFTCPNPIAGDLTYFRAYASSSYGVGYGEVESITPLYIPSRPVYRQQFWNGMAPNESDFVYQITATSFTVNTLYLADPDQYPIFPCKQNWLLINTGSETPTIDNYNFLTHDMAGSTGVVVGILPDGTPGVGGQALSSSAEYTVRQYLTGSNAFSAGPAYGDPKTVTTLA